MMFLKLFTKYRSGSNYDTSSDWSVTTNIPILNYHYIDLPT